MEIDEQKLYDFCCHVVYLLDQIESVEYTEDIPTDAVEVMAIEFMEECSRQLDRNRFAKEHPGLFY